MFIIQYLIHYPLLMGTSFLTSHSITPLLLRDWDIGSINYLASWMGVNKTEIKAHAILHMNLHCRLIFIAFSNCC